MLVVAPAAHDLTALFSLSLVIGVIRCEHAVTGRSVVRWEAVLTSTLGASLGATLGITLVDGHAGEHADARRAGPAAA